MTSYAIEKGHRVGDSSGNLTPAQQRAAELRAEAHGRERRRRLTAIVVGLVIAGGIIGAVVALGIDRDTSTPSMFPAPSDPKAAVAAAGLPMLSREMTEYHIHSYLEVTENGRPIVVPRNIGVAKDGLSPLHTHTPDGVIHVEAAEELKPSLGQFFQQWQVPLSATCLGTMCADGTHELRVYVDGELFRGDPNTIGLEQHRDISVAYVEKGTEFAPKRFDWTSDPNL